MENGKQLSHFSSMQNKQINICVILLAIVGLLFPTSSGSIIKSQYNLLVVLFTLVIMIYMIFVIKKVNVKFLLTGIAINLILWMFTLFSTGAQLEKTPAGFFALLTLLFCINVKSLKISTKTIKWFNLMNYLILFVGFLTIIQNQFVSQLLINNYSAFYPELLPNMMRRGKPVFTFATHSIAGFYMFIFFYLNLKCFQVIQQKKYLIMAIAYLYFCIALQSNTSLLFFIIGLLMLFKSVKKKMRTAAFLSLPTLLGLMIFKDKIHYYWLEFQADFVQTTQSADNGFLGRFSNGNQSLNVEAILANPLSGFGFSPNNPDLLLFDSGLIVTALRGSIVLVVVIYVAFYLFLKKNIINKKEALFLFAVYFIFEIGFNNLYYFRTIMMLPFIIIILNYLEAIPKKTGRVKLKGMSK